MASTICANTPELLSLIVLNLISLESPVAAYSTISRQWRSAIEQHTFSTLYLTPSRLSDFARIVTGTRRGIVRHLGFNIVLDPYNKDVQGQFETPKVQERNNEVFTKAMQALFGYLSAWRVEDVGQTEIDVSLEAFSPSDFSRMEHMTRMT